MSAVREPRALVVRLLGPVFLVVIVIAVFLFTGDDEPGDSSTPTDRSETPVGTTTPDSSATDLEPERTVSSVVTDEGSGSAEEGPDRLWPWRDDPFGGLPRARLSGTVVTADGTPVVGAELSVFVDLDSGDHPELDRVDAWSDAHGVFTLDQAPAHRDLGLQIRHDDGFLFRSVAMLRAGQEHDLGEIVLPAAGRLEGRVTDGHGRALAGHRLVVSGHGDDSATMATRSDEDGWYEFTVAAGVHSVGDFETVLVRPGETVERNVVVDVEFRGQVLLEDGSPVPGARVEVRDATGNERGTLHAGPDGRFIREGNIDYPVDLRVVAGLQELSKRLMGPPFQPLEFVLAPGVAVTFRIHRPLGFPVGASEAELLVLDEPFDHEELDRCDGAFGASGLPPDVEATFSYEESGYEEIVHPFRTPQDGMRVIDLQLVPLPVGERTVAVHVVSTAGVPVAGARVDPGHLGVAAVTDDSGRANVNLRWRVGEDFEEGEVPESIDLLVTAEGFAPRDRRCELEEDGVRLELEAESVVYVVVRDANGATADTTEAWVSYARRQNYDPLIVCWEEEYLDHDRFAEARAPGSARGVSHAVGAGPYRLSQVPEGNGQVFVRTADGHELERGLAIGPGATVPVDFVLPATFDFTCTVSGSVSPARYLRARIEMNADGVRFAREFAFDEDGRANLAVRYTGVYTVHVHDLLTDRKIERGMYVETEGEVLSVSF